MNPMRDCRAMTPRRPLQLLTFVFLIISAARTPAQDSANLSGGPGRSEIVLRPTTNPADRVNAKNELQLGGWNYRSVRSPNPRDGVPWELVATPVEPLPAGWARGRDHEAAGLGPARRVGGDVILRPGVGHGLPFPIVDVPEVLWKQWMPGDLRDVVGIHFHEVASDDLARILFTLHQIPPEEREPGGASGTKKEPLAVRGTRIEATLLAPVTFCLDQSIAVRVDDKHKDLAQRRAQHEFGHAEVSQQVFLAALAGPQDWKPDYCTGRRSRVEYYWRRSEIGRTWDGYRGGKGEIVCLRTTVVLVPPTRWSMMLPVPPERVTQKQIQDFNDSIIHVSQIFAAADEAAQKQFHAQHGEFEEARP